MKIDSIKQPPALKAQLKVTQYLKEVIQVLLQDHFYFMNQTTCMQHQHLFHTKNPKTL